MDTGAVIVMGTISIAGAVVEKVLISYGKSEEANSVKIGTMATVSCTALICVKKVFDALRGL